MTLSPRRRWSESFADASGRVFAAIVSPDVQLDGSIFTWPVHGRHTVWMTLRTASSIYDSIAFTDEASAGDRAYLLWTASAIGLRIDGVTVLRTDDQGLFTSVSIYHRPLAAVLAFSSEMGKRLATSVTADHFYQVP